MEEKTKQWVEEQFEYEEEISKVERLDGGVSSEMYMIEFSNRPPVVIRQISNTSWLEEETDVLLQEKKQLRQLAESHVPTPSFIAVDPYGVHCGMPTLMMTKLPGHLQTTISIDQMLDQLANCANMIHQTKIRDQQYFYEPYMHIEAIDIPRWTADPVIWKKLYDYIQKAEMPSFETSFIHRDYHLNNILWENGSISGVVDWINSCIGPRYIDIAHCRWNLAMTYSVNEADTFLEKYEKGQSSGDSYHIYWDIRSLFDIDPASITVYEGWHHLPISPIDKQTLYERMDAYARSLCKKIKTSK